jgi:hypothetical protein
MVGDDRRRVGHARRHPCSDGHDGKLCSRGDGGRRRAEEVQLELRKVAVRSAWAEEARRKLAMVEHTAAMCGMAAATIGAEDGFGGQRQDKWLNRHTRTRLSYV